MTDLYACGSKVKIPFLGVSSSDSTNRFQHDHFTKLPSRPVAVAPPSYTTTRRKGRVISELSASLKFEDVVVSTHCPEAVTYRDARANITGLYHLPVGMTTVPLQQSHDIMGRCDMRGDGHRHMPCYLHHTTDTTNSRTTAVVRNTRIKHKPVSDHNTDPILPCKSSTTKWEETILGDISLPTAKHFVRQLSKGTEKRRQLEVTVRNMELKGTEVNNQESVHESVQLEPPSSLSSLSPPKDYTTELETGAIPVYVKGSPDTILLSNKITFQKVLQTQYPLAPSEFLGSENQCHTFHGKHIKGHRRWLSLPVRACTPNEAQWVMATTTTSTGKSTPNQEIESKKSEEYIKLPITKTEELVRVAQELLQKWHIHVQSQDFNRSVSLQCLNAVSANTKLYGLGISVDILHKNLIQHVKTTSSLIMTSRKRDNDKEDDDSDEDLLPNEFISIFSTLLMDEVERIRVISAILLCCLERNTGEVLHVLHCSSRNDNDNNAEQWAAIQSLAIEGVCTTVVVKGLLSSLSSSDDDDIQEYQISLLSRLSQKSTLVNAMLLEQLNSKSCQDRFITCKLLPELHGGINKDVCHRLVTMSWDDWSSNVRIAAAQALGKAGQAKLIHDEIEKRLRTLSESTRLDALKKLHTLHLMTSKLLPAFVECFKDDHISVRLQAVIVAEALGLIDDEIITTLKTLMEDNSWKIKAHAIRALGTLKATRPEVLSHLLWAVRFERLPEVRAEACHALQLLGVRSDKVANALRDILIVEDNQLVLSQAQQALIHLGYTPTADDSMAESVCAEVKRLGSLSAITEQILAIQEKEMVQYMLERPCDPLSSRDYLNDKLRHKHFIPGRNTAVFPPIDSSTSRRSWSPDRESINERLEVIRKQCQLDPNSILN